jgi:hypothetical protein
LHDSQTIYPGPASNYALAGVYLDEDTSGWIVNQNVIWNNQYNNIFIHGSSSGQTIPENNSITNNSLIDAGPNGGITLQDVNTCGTTKISNNLTFLPVVQVFYQNSGPNCDASNNGITASGATDNLSPSQVGCNFAGCSSSSPPTIVNGQVSASIAYQPYSMTVNSGSPVTFTAIGAGSGSIKYQWYKNGSLIPGASSSTYTMSMTSSSDNGASFTVVVSNALNSVTSNPAVLTVQ